MAPYARGVVTVEPAGAASWVVALVGEHDASNRAWLAEKLAETAEATAVIVDMSAATFIDSSTVKELVIAKERLDDASARQIAVVAPKDGFARGVLDLLHAERIFCMFETREDALRACEPPEE
jgi:anti-anti-sigma regulatory factor